MDKSRRSIPLIKDQKQKGKRTMRKISYLHVFMCVCTYMYICVCRYTCTCVYVYIYISYNNIYYLI